MRKDENKTTSKNRKNTTLNKLMRDKRLPKKNGALTHSGETQ